jgi:glutamine---fructose-6-phosphate transaminase (isomerizing)
MCGIVGYAGSEARAQDVILDGLRRLEVRGYDSAGIALLESGKLRVIRQVGRIRNLESVLRDVPARGPVGIGHTRWATHGRPSEQNAHPHCAGSSAIVHSGIVENDRELREELVRAGVEFRSETDSEVIAHCIHRERREGQSLLAALRSVVARLVGIYSVVAIDEDEPETLVATRCGGSPLFIGLGRGETFIASDVPAILPYTQEIVELRDGDTAQIRRDGLRVLDARGRCEKRSPLRVRWDPVQAEKAGHAHFMEKEICEQPRAILQTIGARALEDAGHVELDGAVLDPALVRTLRGAVLTGCGSALHAALIGRAMLERLARLPVHVEAAHELREREPLQGVDQLFVAVSQSGETGDTIGALQAARARSVPTLAITNTRGSTLAREAASVLYTHAGPEIAIPSTKGFTTQVVALHLLALELAAVRGTLGAERVRAWIAALRRLPRQVDEALGRVEGMEALAVSLHGEPDFVFAGRGVGHAVALEAALKLKEAGCVHAEGFAAGELAHGPMALLRAGLPVILIANQPAQQRVPAGDGGRGPRMRGARDRGRG